MAPTACRSTGAEKKDARGQKSDFRLRSAEAEEIHRQDAGFDGLTAGKFTKAEKELTAEDSAVC
jgi:hypothetical protein